MNVLHRIGNLTLGQVMTGFYVLTGVIGVSAGLYGEFAGYGGGYAMLTVGQSMLLLSCALEARQ